MKRKNFYFISGTVYFLGVDPNTGKEDDELVVDINVNSIVTTPHHENVPGITSSIITKPDLQTITTSLIEALYQKVGKEVVTNIIDVFVSNISYIGSMTQEDFDNGIKPNKEGKLDA